MASIRKCALPDGLVQKQLTQDREGGERMKKPPVRFLALPGASVGSFPPRLLLGVPDKF